MNGLLFVISYASLSAYKRGDYDKYSLGFEAYIDGIVNDTERMILKHEMDPSIAKCIDSPPWRKNAKINTLDVSTLIWKGLTLLGCSEKLKRAVSLGIRDDKVLVELDTCLKKLNF